VCQSGFTSSSSGERAKRWIKHTTPRLYIVVGIPTSRGPIRGGITPSSSIAIYKAMMSKGLLRPVIYLSFADWDFSLCPLQVIREDEDRLRSLSCPVRWDVEDRLSVKEPCSSNHVHDMGSRCPCILLQRHLLRQLPTR
jgi:hypothetical protein